MEDLYREIIQYWRSHKRQIPWDRQDSVWTKWVKKTFGTLGCKKGFTPEMSKTKKHGNGEYLVDVCWWNEKNDKYWLELALESEWSNIIDEINQDFYKLVDIKAKYKIWICSYGNKIYGTRKQKMLEIIKSAKFSFPHEKYMIINIPDSQKRSERYRLTIYAFWTDYKGNEHPLPDEKIIFK